MMEVPERKRKDNYIIKRRCLGAVHANFYSVNGIFMSTQGMAPYFSKQITSHDIDKKWGAPNVPKFGLMCPLVAQLLFSRYHNFKACQTSRSDCALGAC